MPNFLSIVIHAEEEFQWHKGFYRSNNHVEHDEQLIKAIDKIIYHCDTLILAVNYAFLDSKSGNRVINHCLKKHAGNIEFAAHLHPWVNPPFDSDDNECQEMDSFPGNLEYSIEKEKIMALTNKIETVCKKKPVTYLAGRYGIGHNTASILSSLNYKYDISVSAYSDFKQNHGPDFSSYTNKPFIKNDILHIPHTCSYISSFKFIQDKLNSEPSKYKKFNHLPVSAIIKQAIRLKKFRLSPEGFSLSDMKSVIEAQQRINQHHFIVSFHSSSLKPGATPYTSNSVETEALVTKLIEFINWFKSEKQGVVTNLENNKELSKNFLLDKPQHILSAS